VGFFLARRGHSNRVGVFRGLVGGMDGFVLGFLGVTEGIAVVAGILGAVYSIFFVYLFLCWLLSSRIGNFRLVLVHAQEEI
jgi:hypothetical protein